jgi:hypothetical protein
MIEELLGEEGPSVEQTDKKFYGLTTGTVLNPLDPMMQGRVQVRLPFIDSLDLTAWARVSMSMAGIFSGSYFVPNPGDEVIVAFEHGDVEAPIIIGSLSNLVYQPPLASPLPQIRSIRTLAGNQVVFSEIPPTLTLQTGPTAPEVLPTPPSPVGPHQTISMISGVGIQAFGTSILLQAGPCTLLMNPAGLTLAVGPNAIAITPAGIQILGGPSTTIASAMVGITGGMVRINS